MVQPDLKKMRILGKATANETLVSRPSGLPGNSMQAGWPLPLFITMNIIMIMNKIMQHTQIVQFRARVTTATVHTTL